MAHGIASYSAFQSGIASKLLKTSIQMPFHAAETPQMPWMDQPSNSMNLEAHISYVALFDPKGVIAP